jgi:dATP pyrophosphohydrolase
MTQFISGLFGPLSLVDAPQTPYNIISVHGENFMSERHRKVQVVIAAISQKNQFDILLLETNQKRGQFWQNVTGSVEKNETFEEAALREAMEETQLELESIVEMLDLDLGFHFTDRWERKVQEECFLFVLDKPWDVKIDPKEHQNFKWVPFEVVNQDSVKFPSNYEAIEKSIRLLRQRGV